MYRVYVSLLLLATHTVLTLSQPLINPIKKKVVPGNRPVHTRFFSKIPDYKGQPSRIVFMINQGPNLYACTSTSGGYIYKILPNGKNFLWFNVAAAMVKSTGRAMNNVNIVHGGLRSVAFHPNFNQNGLFYTAVMENKPKQPWKFKYFSTEKITAKADSVVIEWKYNKQTGKVIDTSYRQVIRIGVPVFDHPIRAIMFSGNLLYIAHGDGSVQSATAGGGQRNDGLGKILRINPLKQGNNAYTIPTSNPFVGNSKFKNEIYAYGFRNPINICMSKYKKVGLVGVDVGRDNVDEINLVRPGGNYGWSEREGAFVHKEGGGLVTGIGPLPWNDHLKFKYIYPVVQVGHYNRNSGVRFIGQALAGSCPIENGSPLNNLMLYANFASNGELWYSNIWEMAAAKTTGPPESLWRAKTFKPKIFYDHDGNPNTPPKQVPNLRGVLRMDPGLGGLNRADVRFGRGSRGEIYWSSKRNGKIYLITSSLPNANV